MYFNSYDQKREVRTYENKLKEKNTVSTNELDTTVIYNDSYYEFQYTSRIRRFHDKYNTWSYYDPKFTNIYWYTQSDFGTSIYETYTFWKPQLDSTSSYKLVKWNNMYFNSFDLNSYNYSKNYFSSFLFAKNTFQKNVYNRSKVPFKELFTPLKDTIQDSVTKEPILLTTKSNTKTDNEEVAFTKTARKYDGTGSKIKIIASKKTNMKRSGSYSEGGRSKDNYQFNDSNKTNKTIKFNSKKIP